MTNLRNLLALAALAILPGTTARAAVITINLDPPILLAEPGQTVTFSGTITNTGSVTVDLNGCTAFIAGFTTDNCAVFFDPILGAPLSLDPGTSAPFDMFAVTVDVPYLGAYGLQPPGTVTIYGGLEVGGVYDPEPLNILAEAPFQLDVVPEPGTAALFAVALPVAFALKRCRVAKRNGRGTL
jgi:hypothetical protein